MKPADIKLTRAEKIIITLSNLMGGNSKTVRFEDLVVALFKDHPDEFHLKGYPDYPDSEAVNNALYHTLKKKGLIAYGNKNFSLTLKGKQYAAEILKQSQGKKLERTERLSFYIANEIGRIKKLDGYKLFLSGKEESIYDTDFYNYLGVSVRTSKSDFEGKWNNLSEVAAYLEKKKKRTEIEEGIIAYHKFLQKKFESILQFYLVR